MKFLFSILWPCRGLHHWRKSLVFRCSILPYDHPHDVIRWISLHIFTPIEMILSRSAWLNPEKTWIDLCKYLPDWLWRRLYRCIIAWQSYLAIGTLSRYASEFKTTKSPCLNNLPLRVACVLVPRNGSFCFSEDVLQTFFTSFCSSSSFLGTLSPSFSASLPSAYCFQLSSSKLPISTSFLIFRSSWTWEEEILFA